MRFYPHPHITLFFVKRYSVVASVFSLIPFNKETFGSDKFTFFNFLTALFLLQSEDQGFQEIATYSFQNFVPQSTISTHPYFVLFLLSLFNPQDIIF